MLSKAIYKGVCPSGKVVYGPVFLNKKNKFYPLVWVDGIYIGVEKESLEIIHY